MLQSASSVIMKMRRSIKLTLITLLIAILPLSATSCNSYPATPDGVVQGYLDACEAKNAGAMVGFLPQT